MRSKSQNFSPVCYITQLYANPKIRQVHQVLHWGHLVHLREETEGALDLVESLEVEVEGGSHEAMARHLAGQEVLGLVGDHFVEADWEVLVEREDREDREEEVLFCVGALVEDRDCSVGLDPVVVVVGGVVHFHKEARVALNQLRVCLLHLWE